MGCPEILKMTRPGDDSGGKPQENGGFNGKTIGKPQENGGLPSGLWDFSVISWEMPHGK